MKLVSGRILPPNALPRGLPPLVFSGPSERAYPPRSLLVPRAVVEAFTRAEQLIQEAKAHAREIVAQAEQQMLGLRKQVEAEARASAVAQLSARELTLAAREARADERQLDRTVALARVLAERLLGESLRLDPELVGALARQALLEARGARSIMIFAHPEDVPALTRALTDSGLQGEPIRVRADAGRLRGNLRIETDLGALDAELSPQLDRLAAKLRESLLHAS